MDIITKKSKITDNWFLFLLAGSLLLLYTISRLISLSRRVKDVESRPPVDEIILRGLIRQEVQNHTDKLDALIQQKIENMEVKFEDIEVKVKEEKPVVVASAVPATIVPATVQKIVVTATEPVITDDQSNGTRRSNRRKATATKKVNETKTVNELDLSLHSEI